MLLQRWRGRMGLGLAMVGTLLCGLVVSHQTTASVSPTQLLIACGEVYLPPCL